MLTIEVFLATMSALVVAATAVLLWILTEFRAIRKEVREGFESEKRQRQTDRDADRRERQAEREADRQERREDNRALREDLLAAIRVESEARRADTQRILESIHFHSHDPDGTVALRPPTQQAAD